MHTPFRLAVGCLLFLAACGSNDPKFLTDDGYRALGKGDSKSAVQDFDKAMKRMDPSKPDYLRAAVGHCQALAGLDGKKAKDEFLELARAQPSRVTEQDFSMVVDALSRGHSLVDAVDVMHAGVQMFPESPKMEALREAVVEESQKADDPEALKSLKGLGYIGK